MLKLTDITNITGGTAGHAFIRPTITAAAVSAKADLKGYDPHEILAIFTLGAPTGTVEFKLLSSDTVSGTASGMTAIYTLGSLTVSGQTYAAYKVSRGDRKRFIGAIITPNGSSVVACTLLAISQGQFPSSSTQGFLSITAAS